MSFLPYNEALDGFASECESCGGSLAFDPERVGDTCGGVTRRGWLTCARCGAGWLSKRGRPVEHWKIASSGRSVETSVGRIRVDGGEDTTALCARLVKLPDLELEVERLRRRVAELEAGQ